MPLQNQPVDLFGPLPVPARSLGTVTDDLISSPAMHFYLTARAWLSPIIIGASAYHGYKRNHESYGWGVGWATLAVFAPFLTGAFMLAQGFGKPKKGKRS